MKEISFDDVKQELLKDQEIKEEYEKLKPEYDLRKKLIALRTEAGFTQSEIADLLNTQKSNISRLESINSKNSPRLSTIENYAKALGYSMQIKFVREKQA